ncbi:MAG: glucose-methanol-choline oxidoreductase [Geminicoccaceae bacterium]|nr:glucose-methanol-choline oxidoreductase [Geminicoccaceae bacterium]
MRAAQEAGLPHNPDFNGERQEGCGLYQVTQRGARRCSAAVGYLKPALARGNLTVLTGCHATRILVERGRAVGVEYRAGGEAELRTARAEQEVVVASGAVGSPRLLLLSGIGPADELERIGVTPLHDLRGVGRNLQDHIDVYVICELAGPHSYDRHTRPHRMLWAGVQYLLFGNGPVTSNLAEGGAFWYADSEQRSPDIQFHFLPGAGLEAGVPPVAGHGCTLNSCHLRPRSRGSVRLQSADPLTAPLIDPNYWAEPYDLEMSLRGFALTREIMAQPALRQYVKHEHLPGAAAKTRADLEAYARR